MPSPPPPHTHTHTVPLQMEPRQFVGLEAVADAVEWLQGRGKLRFRSRPSYLRLPSRGSDRRLELMLAACFGCVHE